MDRTPEGLTGLMTASGTGHGTAPGMMGTGGEGLDAAAVPRAIAWTAS